MGETTHPYCVNSYCCEHEFRHHDKFSRATGNWSTAPMKVPKTYPYIDTLIMEVVNKRELADSRLDAPVVRDPSDPKRIRQNVAKVPKPPKAELIERHTSRFSK